LYQIDTFLQFDGGAWEQAFRTIVIDHTLFASVTETPTPVNCSGKLLLTGIKCIVIATGRSVTLSGDVRVMGIGKAVTPL
jgi:hypothetical protein